MRAQLFVRSNYSLLNGLMSVDEIIDFALKNEYEAIALVDYKTMFASLGFYLKAKKHNIKAILGLEVDVEDYRLVLYAKNNQGLQALHKFSYKLSKDKSLDLEDIKLYENDLIIVLPSEKGPFESIIYEDNLLLLDKRLDYFKNYFNQVYLGLSHQDSSFFKEINLKLANLAKEKNIKSISMPKILYKNKEDHYGFKAVNAIRLNKTYNDPSIPNALGRYFYSKEEMDKLYPKEWIENINEIVDRCNIDLLDLKTNLPEYENSYNVDNKLFIKELSKKGLKKRLGKDIDYKYMNRLNHELEIIEKMDFTNYFLIVYDVVRFAKQKGINVGPGRGSSVGSLVSYSLGIIDVDPIEYDLIFERFLNPQRKSMPDIDIDFPGDRIEEVIQYVKNRYGFEHVSNIISFNKFTAKQSLNEIAKILNIPRYEISRLSNMVSGSLMNTYKTVTEFSVLVNSNEKLKECFDLALKIENNPHYFVLHPSGYVISEDHILKVAPLYQFDDERITLQYDMNDIESLGLIKIDLLVVQNLTLITRIVNKIKEEDENFNLNSISLEDKNTFDLLSRGATTGLFQVDSSEMSQLLKRLNPSKITDIVDALALNRPGPLQFIPQYLENRQNPSMIKYQDEVLKEITKSTYGILIYQEQIMQTAQLFAGFSMADADILRRSMSDKDSKQLDDLKLKFINGALEKGHSEDLSNKIFDLIHRFSRYGFAKSHSVAYSHITYYQAYLKANHPIIFYTELLNLSLNDPKKTKLYLDESFYLNVNVEMPGLNTSTERYYVYEETIRMPLTIVKGIAKDQAQRIVLEREANGLYTSYIDAVVRLDKIGLDDSQIESLINAGVFDIFNLNRNMMRANISAVIMYGKLITVKDRNDNISLNYSLVSAPELEKLKENREENFTKEFEALGFYLTEYPTKRFREQYKTVLIQNINPKFKSIKLVLRADEIYEHIDKNGNDMAFITSSDESGDLSLILFASVYKHITKKPKLGDIILVEGSITKDGRFKVDKFNILT